MKFYYSQIYKRRFFLNIPRAKRETKLPVVLSKDEIKKILNQIANIKHKLLLALMYSAGLRISEITKLKVKDLDFENKVLCVRGGKGRKDGQTFLPKIMQKILKKYVSKKKLGDYFKRTVPIQ